MGFMPRLDTAEEKISEVEQGKYLEGCTEEKTEKSQRHKDADERSNILVLGVQEGEKRENKVEVRFEEMMMERFLKQVAKHISHGDSGPQAP